MATKICVVGAGVVGLSCAVRVKQALGSAAAITIIADKFGKDTTSHVAAGGFRVEKPPKISGYNGKRATVEKDVVLLSFNKYYGETTTAHASKAGISKLEGYIIKYPGVEEPDTTPLYQEYFRSWRPIPEKELYSMHPALPKESSGDYVETVVVSPRTYMSWLLHRHIDTGGKVKEATVDSFDELWSEYDVVFNCTGLRADHLTGDKTLYPVRGQIIRAVLPAAQQRFAYIHNGTDRPVYFYWTPDGTVLGGTKLVNDSNLGVLPADHDYIIHVTQNMFPYLDITQDKIFEESVGLRPYRPAIRLESESCRYRGKKKLLIHNYGHGSHGVSCSWGTACVAVELLTDNLNESKL